MDHLVCVADIYDWPAVKRLFVTILIEIEMGVREWDEDTSRLEQQIPMSFTLSKSNINTSSTWSGLVLGVVVGKEVIAYGFVPVYQKKCAHKEPHPVKENGTC